MIAGTDKQARALVHRSARESLTLVDEAIARCHAYLRQRQYSEGYWWGQLESNPTMEAEYIFLSCFLGRKDAERWRKMSNYILGKQQADGSWGQYYGAPGDVSTSVECYFALKLAGCPADREPLRRARRFILSRGGVPSVRVFTKVWLALFGQWDWKGTPNMPPELIFLPPWAPLNIYEFASWARGTIVPLLIILTRQPVCPVPAEANIDELYPMPRDQVDYALPSPGATFSLAGFFYHLDRLIGLYRKLPVHPFRREAERRILEWIINRQEADGSWGGIQPPWVYSLMALQCLGLPSDHPALEKGYHGFAGFAIEDEDTCTVQACLSPVWDTCLVQQALLESGVAPDDAMVQASTQWLISRQIDAPGDWQVKAGRAPSGGWSFEFHNRTYPDVDDVAEVIIALSRARLTPEEEPAREAAVDRGVQWLLAMQSRNGGWAAFDKDNNRRYLTSLPFADFGEVLDPPSVDVTAHVVEMFGRLGYTRAFPPVKRACDFIMQQQEANGSWFGRWGVNYIYGVGAVLPALEAVGEDMRQPCIRRAVRWLLEHQGADGGWGESCGSYVDRQLHGAGPSTASQTAWALLALLAAGEVRHQAVRKGIDYLVKNQQSDGSWDEPYFTGVGFPGYIQGEPPKTLPQPGERNYQGLDLPAGFMINYHMYRNCWPLLALGRYRRKAKAFAGSPAMERDR